jgi:hypothetical protein
MTTYFATYLKALDALEDPQVLGEEWVIHPPTPDYGYDETPRNALTFAVMGVDGVHYSILTESGTVEDDSAVVQINPMDDDIDVYRALAENFLQFLAIGCGVSEGEMKAVFDAERSGKAVLGTFLKARFDISKLWNEDRQSKLSMLLDRIEPKPNSRLAKRGSSKS